MFSFSFQFFIIRNFEDKNSEPFRFGFIGSSDNHSSRPGTGFKEIDRIRNTDSKYKSSNAFMSLGQSQQSFDIPRSQEINLEQMIDRMYSTNFKRLQ